MRHPQGSLGCSGWPNLGHRPSTPWSGVGAYEGGRGAHSLALYSYATTLCI